MTDNNKHITLADIRDAMSLHGADLNRWPSVDRAQAHELAQSSLTFSRLLEQEHRLETQLRAADPLFASGPLPDADAFAAHIAASALRITQSPRVTVNPANFRRLSPEKKRGFRLIPFTLIDAAKRVTGKKDAPPAGLLPPPGRSAQTTGVPQVYHAQDIKVMRLPRRRPPRPGFTRIAAGIACCLVAGWTLGALMYAELPPLPATLVLSASGDIPLSAADDYFSF